MSIKAKLYTIVLL